MDLRFFFDFKYSIQLQLKYKYKYNQKKAADFNDWQKVEITFKVILVTKKSSATFQNPNQ